MLFYSFFKSLIGKEVVVELKNDLAICGTLHSVDQYLNIKLTDISVTDPDKYPHMLSVKNCFIRGSVIRYVQLPADEVDTQLLQDAARKESMHTRNPWRPELGNIVQDLNYSYEIYQIDRMEEWVNEYLYLTESDMFFTGFFEQLVCMWSYQFRLLKCSENCKNFSHVPVMKTCVIYEFWYDL